MSNLINVLNKRYKIALMSIIVIAVLGRIIPHPANMTPFLSIAVFSGYFFKGKLSYLIVLASYVISNYLLGILYGYSFWGMWLLFSLSGYLLITILASHSNFAKSWKKLGLFVLFASFSYWLWTNLGVWLYSGLYPHTAESLLQCYIFALPFLKNAVLGDLFWSLVIYLFHYYLRSRLKVVEVL